MITLNDRRRGCFLGLIIGDALGQSIEFRSPGSFPPITTFRGGGPHNLNAGDWTDDTSMALALSHSLKKGWNLNDQADNYVDWYQNGKYSVNNWCFDIGSTTKQSLERYMENKDAIKSGLTSPSASGNGGIMRLAPVPIKYYNEDAGLVFERAVESSSVTHASEMCKSAAGYMGIALYALLNGTHRDTVLADDWYDRIRQGYPNLPELHSSVADVARGSYKRKSPPEPEKWWPGFNDGVIRGSGFVVESLEAALWAFYNGKDFRDAVLSGINLGEDSDTTGAICGQFAGAFWGESGIPQEWRDGISRMDLINEAWDCLK